LGVIKILIYTVEKNGHKITTQEEHVSSTRGWRSDSWMPNGRNAERFIAFL